LRKLKKKKKKRKKKKGTLSGVNGMTVGGSWQKDEGWQRGGAIEKRGTSGSNSPAKNWGLAVFLEYGRKTFRGRVLQVKPDRWEFGGKRCLGKGDWYALDGVKDLSVIQNKGKGKRE